MTLTTAASVSNKIIIQANNKIDSFFLLSHAQRHTPYVNCRSTLSVLESRARSYMTFAFLFSMQFRIINVNYGLAMPLVWWSVISFIVFNLSVLVFRCTLAAMPCECVGRLVCAKSKHLTQLQHCQNENAFRWKRFSWRFLIWLKRPKWNAELFYLMVLQLPNTQDSLACNALYGQLNLVRIKW